MTKIVNTLMAATKISGPAACALLLGLPDHYTSHIFKTVYWYSYVLHVTKDLPEFQWPITSDFTRKASEAPDNNLVVIGHTSDGIVPMSKVNNYLYWPDALENMCLYNFLCITDVHKLRKNESVQGCTSEIVNVISKDQDNDLKGPYRFRPLHPCVDTHCLVRLTECKVYTVNFAGCALPRADKGNMEEYTFVMLVLFSPGRWCHGNNLVKGWDTWKVYFNNTTFAPEHLVVMRNMGVLYEYFDARDDFAAQHRQGALDILNPGHNFYAEGLDKEYNGMEREG